jgi:nitroreductase
MDKTFIHGLEYGIQLVYNPDIHLFQKEPSMSEMPSHHGQPDTNSTSFANETMRLLAERASCRSFLPKPIPPEVLHSIFEAGNHAATGGNLQPYSIIKIESQPTKQKLAEMCEQGFIGEAPVDLIFCIDSHRLERWAQIEVAPFSHNDSFPSFWIAFQDTMIAAQNICTAADAMGLGSVYIGTIMGFFPQIVEMLSLPKGVCPVVLLSMGYPKGKMVPRRKLGSEVFVHDEKYHEFSDEELVAFYEGKYPGQKVDITEERLEKIASVARGVHGEDFSKRCLEKIKEYGYIRPVHRYFGLHYTADDMSQHNDEFVKALKDMGFGIFENRKLH